MEAEQRGSKRTLEDLTLQPGRSYTSTRGDGCSRGRNEVVCQSPKSGRIFKTSINLHETTNESVKKKQVRDVMGKYSDPRNERSDRLKNELLLRPCSGGVRGGRGAGSGLGTRERGRSPRRDKSADERRSHFIKRK